jgi:hypothetical protein
MRSLFDPIIDKIIELVRVQVMTVSAGPQRVNVCQKAWFFFFFLFLKDDY